MRKLILIVVMFISPTLVAPTIPVDSVEIIKTEPTISEHDQFLNDIGFRESGNRYTIVNEFGYMGKYQFGKATLRTLKIKVTKDAFLNSPDLQEYAMEQNLIYNKKKLLKYIKLYEGETVHGIFITESGILLNPRNVSLTLPSKYTLPSSSFSSLKGGVVTCQVSSSF